jgi:hypothetical protein
VSQESTSSPVAIETTILPSCISAISVDMFSKQLSMREFRNRHVYALGLDSGRMIAISTYRVLKSAPAQQQQRFSPSPSLYHGFPTTYVYAMLDHAAFATSFDFVMDSPHKLQSGAVCLAQQKTKVLFSRLTTELFVRTIYGFNDSC